MWNPIVVGDEFKGIPHRTPRRDGSNKEESSDFDSFYETSQEESSSNGFSLGNNIIANQRTYADSIVYPSKRSWDATCTQGTDAANVRMQGPTSELMNVNVQADHLFGTFKKCAIIPNAN
jgi:hypothetical protein